ncbi:MAG TPA: GAF domain-containing protein [Anaerolineae bacterium]|nr:GAF domain-containing protein [Anaerolineae bacterium]
MANPNEIAVLEAVLGQAQKVIEFDSFYAALYDRVTVQLEFPVVAQRRDGKLEVLRGETAPWSPRPYTPGEYFPDALFPAGQPSFIPSDVQTWLQDRGLRFVPEPDSWPRSWFGAPLKARGRTIGFVAIEHHSRDDAFDQTARQLFAAMANRAAGTLATTRLLESLRAVNRVGQELTAGAHLKVGEILTRIHEAVGRLMDNRDMYVALYDRGTQTLSFPLAFEDGKPVQYSSRKAELDDPTRGGLTEVVLRTQQPFCPPDVAQWYDERGGPPVTAAIPKSWVGVPLLRGKQVLGVIALQNDEVAELYGSDDIEVLQAMSGAAAVALANTRLFEQLSVVNDAGQKLAAGIQLAPDQILDEIYKQASRLMDTRDMYIALYDAETQELSFPLAMLDGEWQYDWPSRKVDLTGEMQGLTEVVLQTRESLCPTDVEVWYKDHNIEPKVKPVPKSWVGVPLVRENQVLGSWFAHFLNGFWNCRNGFLRFIYAHKFEFCI